MQRILIVDDHDDIRRLLSITMGKSYEILEAEEGVAALEAVRRHRPDVVFLDVMMPGEMDGLQVLEAIKSDPQTRSTLVAMVTARGQAADSEEARKLGADGYFVKPFSPLQMMGWVRSHLK